MMGGKGSILFSTPQSIFYTCYCIKRNFLTAKQQQMAERLLHGHAEFCFVKMAEERGRLLHGPGRTIFRAWKAKHIRQSFAKSFFFFLILKMYQRRKSKNRSTNQETYVCRYERGRGELELKQLEY